jgi:hypothetical protein
MRIASANSKVAGSIPTVSTTFGALKASYR